jgi:D-tyrosyl-tRNA(Tyr) deacylase
MRLVIQRVAGASVSIAGKGVVGAVDKGLCVLVGFTAGDGDKELEWAVHHILNGKYWPSEEGAQWKKSLQDYGYQVLVVSQFTLYAQVRLLLLLRFRGLIG